MHNASAANQAVPLETYGGLVTLARPENVPEGASPRNYDMDFLVGSAQTRAGLENVYSYEDAEEGPNGGSAAVNVAVTGNAWSSPGSVLADDGSFAQCVPSAGSDALNVTGFHFNLPSSATPTGITVGVKGFSSAALTLTVRLLVAGAPAGSPKTLQLPATNGPVSIGTATDLWGAGLAYADLNNPGFGVEITAECAFPLGQVSIDFVTVTVGLSTSQANFTYLTTFVAQDGSVKNVSLDATGNFWVEDVTNKPGVLTLAFDGVTPGSYANGVNGPGVEYLAFHDLTAGSDVPRQYTPQWTDRISQVGPGASPVFAAGRSSTLTYAIASITQPAQQARGFSYYLQSTGPGTTSPGTVYTIYYSDSTVSGADADLVAAFNSGNPVLVYLKVTNANGGGGSVIFGPETVAITSVGQGTPPGQPRSFYYFTFVQSVPPAYGFRTAQQGCTATYQRTLATLTTSVPVPSLTVGSNAVVTGSSVAQWDNTWRITQTPNSGAMVITQTTLTNGVATYSYDVSSGANPTAGQLVTITGTLNANGQLNGVNLTIASVAGTNVGTFTIANFSAAADYPAAAEQGQATTAGTVFAFEPGELVLNTASSPIYGNATGGQITVTGSGQYVGAGTRQGVVFFITRNGYYTAPGPPVTFTIPEDTTELLASLIPIGPPNVIARGIAVTEAGANGVPGANFFTIPEPVQYVVQGVTYTSSSLIIRDNTTTSASFTFTDSVLLNAEAIDIQGNNLFNLIEIGNPGFIVSYDSRNFYGLCQNKVQNFTNPTFDGGYLPGGQLAPLGWTAPDSYGQLSVSPIFGNSYYINNTTPATLDVAGLISQSAYQDAYQQPILSASTAYSVRVTARIPSGKTTGSLVVDLTAGGISYGSFTLAFAAMSTSMAIYTGTLLANQLPTMPAELLLQLYAATICSGADVEIDRLEIFPTAIPVLSTTLFGSYAADLESVDAVTGPVKFESENQQPLNGGVVMYDVLYGLKAGSMYSLQASPNLEPSQWNEPEVAQRAGSCGINAYDFGEQWFVEACRNGLYLFEGGQPGKIMQEIYQVWDAINWTAGRSIWVKNDVTGRRLFIGVPLPTPNFWLPDAPANPAPTSPNVILMCNYQGCESAEELKTGMQLHTTMFGSLNAVDMRRKWSIWQIPCPFANAVSTSGQVTGERNILDAEVRFCNGIGSSKIYRLNPEAPSDQAPTDDGAAIQSLYTTYGYVNASKAQQMPLLGVFRKLWTYMTHQVSGTGKMNVRLLPNTLLGPGDDATKYYPWTLPGGFQLTDPCTQAREAPLNFAGTRTFVEMSTKGRMDISNLVMVGRKHLLNQLTGRR